MDATQVYKEISDALDYFHEDTPTYKLYEFKLRGLLDKCRAEIEANTLSGDKKDRFKAALSFAKYCQKELADSKPMMAGAWVDEKGRQGICNGYILAVYEKPYGGLPAAELPEDGHTLRIDEITPKGYDATGTLPNPRVLKSEVKNAKLEYKKPAKTFEHLTFLNTGDDTKPQMCFNTENLIIAIECAGSQTFEYFKNNILTPIKIDGDGGYTLCVPVKYSPEERLSIPPSYSFNVAR